MSSSVSLSSKGASLSSISEQDDSPSSSTGVNITKKAQNGLTNKNLFGPLFKDCSLKWHVAADLKYQELRGREGGQGSVTAEKLVDCAYFKTPFLDFVTTTILHHDDRYESCVEFIQHLFNLNLFKEGVVTKCQKDKSHCGEIPGGARSRNLGDWQHCLRWVWPKTWS